MLCLGDSITFGWGVRYEEAYPTLLADLLRKALPEREIQVLNAACSGYTAYPATGHGRAGSRQRDRPGNGAQTARP